MAEDIRVSLNIKKSKYLSLQMEESTDNCNRDQFIRFVRYDTRNSISKDILFCTNMYDFDWVICYMARWC